MYGTGGSHSAVSGGTGAGIGLGAGVAALIGGAIGAYAGERIGERRDGYGYRGNCGCGCGNNCGGNCGCKGHYPNGYGYAYDGYRGDWKFDRLERDLLHIDKDVALGRLENHKDAIINRNDLCCCMEKETGKVLKAMNDKEICDLRDRNIELQAKLNRVEMERYIDCKFDKQYAENCKLACEIKEVGGIAASAVHGVHHLKKALTHECIKPAGTMTFPNFCEEKHFRSEVERNQHFILRDLERLNRDFEERHRHNHRQHEHKDKD